MAAAEVQTPFVGNTGPQTAHSGKNELDQLKEIAKQALQEHERLKKKYEESQRIQKRLKDQLVSREQELIRIQNVSEAACDEFAEIKAQLEVEQFCREEAESYATKMVKQNKSIKRKSAAILGVNNWASIEISLEEDDEDGTHENTSEQERLNGLKDELTALRKDLDVASEDKIVLKAELKVLKQQLEQERLSNSALKDALKQRDRSIQQLSRVSTLVVSEFEEISENYERETVLRKKAECFAAKMYQENKVVSEVAKRQSQILMDPTQLTLPSDEKLMEAMKELEELNSMLVDKNEKQDKEESDILPDALIKVRDELNTNEDNGQPKKEYVHTLETKLSIAQEENENLEQQINELQDELKKVKEQLEVASEKLRPPPPPPPPPLPAPVKNPLSLFRKLIKGKNTDDKQGKADPLQEKYTATIDEMMKRIKSGKAGLKPVGEDERRPIERGRSSKLSRKNTPTPAMMELHGLLKKTSSNRPPLIKSSSESEATSEFLNIMNRRRQKMEIGESIKENGAKDLMDISNGNAVNPPAIRRNSILRKTKHIKIPPAVAKKPRTRSMSSTTTRPFNLNHSKGRVRALQVKYEEACNIEEPESASSLSPMDSPTFDLPDLFPPATPSPSSSVKRNGVIGIPQPWTPPTPSRTSSSSSTASGKMSQWMVPFIAPVSPANSSSSQSSWSSSSPPPIPPHSSSAKNLQSPLHLQPRSSSPANSAQINDCTRPLSPLTQNGRSKSPLAFFLRSSSFSQSSINSNSELSNSSDCHIYEAYEVFEEEDNPVYESIDNPCREYQRNERYYSTGCKSLPNSR